MKLLQAKLEQTEQSLAAEKDELVEIKHKLQTEMQ